MPDVKNKLQNADKLLEPLSISIEYTSTLLKLEMEIILLENQCFK